MLYLVHFDETHFTRPLFSFKDDPPVYIVEFDASLKGAGVVWYRRHAIDLHMLNFGGDLPVNER